MDMVVEFKPKKMFITCNSGGDDTITLAGLLREWLIYDFTHELIFQSLEMTENGWVAHDYKDNSDDNDSMCKLYKAMSVAVDKYVTDNILEGMYQIGDEI